MINLLTLPFQQQMLQAPWLFPETRFFFGVAGYGCVHEDTELDTPGGPVKIKDFRGGLIYAYDEVRRQKVAAIASAPKAYKKVPMFAVRLSNSKCIIVTAKHRFLTSRGYRTLDSFRLESKTADPDLISCASGMTSIESITPVGGFVYYDVNVPVYHNYFAAGVVHHNSGKSRLLSLLLLKIISELSGKKDRNGHRPRGILAGVTLGHLQRTVLQYVLEDLDNSKTAYVHDKKNNVLHIAGVDIMLMAMAVPENIRGEDAHFVLADEVDDIGKVTGSDDTTFEAVRALNERCRQIIDGDRKSYMIMVSTSQGQKGLYRIYTDFKKSGTGFALVRGRTVDNWYLDPSYVEGLRKIYSETEFRVYAEGEFLALASGRVFSDFDWERNFIKNDMDQNIPKGETVYTSFDLNCIAEGETVYTLRGDIPIEQVKAGDFVLTRQGYKKVLTVKDSGFNDVSMCCRLYSTRGHIFRTPEGDVPQWKVKKCGSVYYLPKHVSLRLRIEKTAEMVMSVVSELDSTELPTTGIPAEEIYRLQSILSVLSIVKCSMSLFGSIITFLLTGGIVYTIQMVLMIIDLNRLYVFLKRNIQGYTRENGGRKTGKVNWLISLKAMTKRLRGGLSERRQVDIARNIKIIGNDRIGKGEREYRTRVYDLEVEDAHEYFVNGVLVHNSGYNRGCAFRLIDGVLYAVKSYDFPDLRDAPKVLRYDFPHSRILFIPDTTAREQVATFIRELHRYDIHYIFRSKNPLVEDSVFLVNKLLYTSRFLVCPMARDLAEAMAIEMRDKNGEIPKGKGPSSPVHLTDSARWTAYFLALTDDSLNDIRMVTIARHEAIRSTLSKPLELGSGYVDMNPLIQEG